MIKKEWIEMGIILVWLLAGCTAPPKTPTPIAKLSPPLTEDIPKVNNPGSLFQPAQAEYLFADNRARRVGDILLINILESATGKTEAGTTADRDSSIDVGVSNWLGHSKFLGLWPVNGTASLVKGSTSTKFDNDAKTSRETSVSATIAARVIRVLPNGLMQVEGSREVRVNGENQIITVSGLVRARDIGPDNSISSSQLADARINFYGEGVLADKQHPGWLTRIIDNVWPF